MTNTRPAPGAAAGANRLGWVLALTSTAHFMVLLDSSVVLTALPRMLRLRCRPAATAPPAIS